MPVAIHNFDFTYQRKGKPVFVPSSRGRRTGLRVKEAIEANFVFPDTYFHMGPGGHVAALHHHRDSAFFARIDIARFFYSISRRRAQSALSRIGVTQARIYAKWSTVRNPYGEPMYSLPYGFIQSPILASLVIATSKVGEHIAAISQDVRVSVYMDDIALSGDDLSVLRDTYSALISVLEAEGFEVNGEKLRPPSEAMDIFNCDLSTGRASVRDERIEEFLATSPNQESQDAFVAYCATVEAGNTG